MVVNFGVGQIKFKSQGAHNIFQVILGKLFDEFGPRKPKEQDSDDDEGFPGEKQSRESGANDEAMADEEEPLIKPGENIADEEEPLIK